MSDPHSTLQPSALDVHRGARSGPTRPGLVLVYAAGQAQATPLFLEDNRLDLGRSENTPGGVPDPRVSRRHAQLSLEHGQFLVTDVGSQNGTFVDGDSAPLIPGTPRVVERVLRLGDALLLPSRDLRALEQSGVTLCDGLIRGPAMQELLTEAARAAALGLVLHIRGESGTGKEGVARAFHDGGPQHGGAFIAVNCAAIPEGVAERLLFGTRRGAYSGAEADAPGYFQEADGGTLFLDEIVELDLGVQAKLLRVLETREVTPLGAARAKRIDFRMCSATCKDMRALVAAGRLREDLYYRIARPEVVLPPLRNRPEEITLLLHHELKRMAPTLNLHVSLVEACLLRPWPGNVRELLAELRSAVQTALLQKASRVMVDHLAQSAGMVFGAGGQKREAPPPAARPPRPRSGDADEHDAERQRIEQALDEHAGNVAATARALGLHRTQLRRLIERYRLHPGADGEEES